MRPRGTQNGSQNREKCETGPIMLPRNYKNRFWPMSHTPWGGFLASPGYPKIDQKWYFTGKWGSQGSIFAIFAQKGAATHLFIDFSSISYQKIDVFFVVFFQASSLFFGHGDLHDSMVFSNRNLLFHFLFFCFFLQKMIKNQCKKPDEKKG